MRVLHFSTFDLIGGAARAAFQLHEGLCDLGVDSEMLVQRKDSTNPAVRVAPQFSWLRWRFWTFLEREYLQRNRTPLSNTWFTAGYPGHDVTRHEAVAAADVLHLHWVTHFLSPTVIAALRRLGKPIVWTLHDQRPFTGGCHFSAGCDGYTRDCAPCPQLACDPCRLPARNLRDQREALRGAPVTIVTPSRWLGQCARSSAVLGAARVEVIAYGIDPARFFPVPQAEARARLGLPLEARCILFGADNGEERRKGARELLTAFQHLLGSIADPGSVLLVSFGKTNPLFASLGPQARSLGVLRDPADLRDAYAAADVFALPSTEDNLPMTLLEALACGTPVAAYPVPGPVDILTPASGAMAAQLDDAIAMALTLDRNAALAHGRSFTWERSAQQFLDALVRAAPAAEPSPLAA